MIGSSQDSSPNERSLKGLAPKDLALKGLALKDLAFEDALAELESIVHQLEQGSSRLEESITIYERGEVLKAHCQQLLSRAQVQVEKITRVAEQEKNDASVSKSSDAEGGDENGNKGEDGEENFVREDMAVSNGDLVSSLARRG